MIFLKSPKTMFLGLDPFCSFLPDGDFRLSHTTIYAKFQKKLMSQSRETLRTDGRIDGRTNGRTDGQTLFYRTLQGRLGVQ